MVKEKASYLAPDDAIKRKPIAKMTKQPIRSKLSSTARRDMLATIYERTHSVPKTLSSRSVPCKGNENYGTKQRAVQMSNTSDGPNDRPVFPSQSGPGNFNDTSIAEDRATKQVAPSVSSKSSPHLEKWNDDCERVGSSLNREEDGQNFHLHYPSNSPFSRGINKTYAVENGVGKQVKPSGDRKSSPHPAGPRKSSDTGVFSSSKSEKQHDGCGRVDLSRKDKEVSRKKLICNDGPMNSISTTEEVGASSSRIVHPANSSTSSAPVKPIKNSVVCPNNHESQKRKSSDLYDSLKYPRNGPALQIIWKGAFDVVNLSQGLGFCERLIAHLSAKVSAKAYKFSQQITGVLRFKSVSRGELWPELFQIRSPDWNDIALYFYPEKTDSSKKKYAALLQYMVKNDLLLRTRIGHVELLCCASKTLALDCQQMKGNYFIWGVFRRLKGNRRTQDTGCSSPKRPVKGTRR